MIGDFICFVCNLLAVCEVSLLSQTSERCHEKMCLKIFVVVIPKEKLEGPRQSFFGHDTDYKIVLCCLHRLYSVDGVLTREGLVGPRQSFFWYDNDKDLKAHFLMTQLRHLINCAIQRAQELFYVDLLFCDVVLHI